MTTPKNPTWIWALPCVVLLIYGAALRWPTLQPPENYLQYASGRLAYSDVVVFYKVDNPVPYLERNIEYPVLTGLTIWLTSSLPGGNKGYFLANALLLSASLLACFAYLVRLGPPVRLMHFALAPGLALYNVLNWDALGLLGLVAAVYYTRRRRFEWAGASLAFGASAKLFPAFVLPVLWAHAAQRPEFQEGGGTAVDWLRSLFAPDARRLLIAFAVVTAALNLPVALLNFRGWSYFLTFQAGRTHNLDSIWQYLPPIPDQAQSLIFALVFIGGIAWLSFRVLQGDRWEIAALLSLVLFLLATKVYSPQYDLWLLPMLALVACPTGLWLAFVLVDAGYYGAIFFFYYLVAGGESQLDVSTATFFVGTSVWLRELVLVLLFIWGVRRMTAPDGEREGSLLSCDLEALTSQTSELKQLRLAVDALTSEVESRNMSEASGRMIKGRILAEADQRVLDDADDNASGS